MLIAVTSIAGVLSQQGISLGKAGTGTVVSLAAALATALLGLLARDPKVASQQPTPPNGPPTTSVKLGVWMLIALLLPLPWLQGCSGVSVAEDIVNWTPTLESAVATVDSTASLLAPADAPSLRRNQRLRCRLEPSRGAGQGLSGQSHSQRIATVAVTGRHLSAAGERGAPAGGQDCRLCGLALAVLTLVWEALRLLRN